MRLHPPTRHCRRRLLLPALAQDQRQHPFFARPQHQPPRRRDVEAGRIAPNVKHHRGKTGAARRLVSRPHRALQIARLDKRQRRRVKPVLGKACRKQPAAIAAGRRIIDPDNPAGAYPHVRGCARSQPERKSRAGANVTGQRTAQLMQPATGKPAVEQAVDVCCAQRQRRQLPANARQRPAACATGRGLMGAGVHGKDVRRGLEPRESHRQPKMFLLCFI
jgi:hypothetical protein